MAASYQTVRSLVSELVNINKSSDETTFQTALQLRTPTIIDSMDNVKSLLQLAVGNETIHGSNIRSYVCDLKNRIRQLGDLKQQNAVLETRLKKKEQSLRRRPTQESGQVTPSHVAPPQLSQYQSGTIYDLGVAMLELRSFDLRDPDRIIRGLRAVYSGSCVADAVCCDIHNLT